MCTPLPRIAIMPARECPMMTSPMLMARTPFKDAKRPLRLPAVANKLLVLWGREKANQKRVKGDHALSM